MLTRLTRFRILAGSLCVVFAGAFSAQAQEAPDSEEERLAKRLANPIAALISVPFQFNYDSDFGRRVESGHETAATDHIGCQDGG
jgi:hypothetical protein